MCSCGLRIPVKNATLCPHPPAKVEKAEARDPDVELWLISGSYHTGIVFPYEWLYESGYIPPAGFGHPKYVTMSWGNRDAYSEVGMDNAWKWFRVLCTPTPSVTELIPFNGNVPETCPKQRIWRTLVPRSKGPEVAAFLNSNNKLGPDGRLIVVAKSSWGKGVQLEARHSYFIPRVCNVWTAQVIETTGGKMHPWLGLTAGGIIRQAEAPPNHYELVWPGRGKLHP